MGHPLSANLILGQNFPQQPRNTLEPFRNFAETAPNPNQSLTIGEAVYHNLSKSSSLPVWLFQAPVFPTVIFFSPVFGSQEGPQDICPELGSVVLFSSELLHEVRPLALSAGPRWALSLWRPGPRATGLGVLRPWLTSRKWGNGAHPGSLNRRFLSSGSGILISNLPRSLACSVVKNLSVFDGDVSITPS